MLTFRDTISENLFKEEIAPERSIVFCWGRFNPPTLGHQVVFQRAKRLSKAKEASFQIFTSQTHDQDKNPLSYDEKISTLRRYFPKLSSSIVKNDNIRTLFDVVENLIANNFTKGWLVVGEDRVMTFQKQMNRYYSDKIKIQVVSAGDRDSSGGVKSISGSVLRNYVKNKNLEMFKKYSPTGVEDTILEDVYHMIRRAYGISHQTSEGIELPRSEAREKLYSGYFKPGDMVLANEEIGKVKSIGANYVNVEMLAKAGQVKQFWTSDITKI